MDWSEKIRLIESKTGKTPAEIAKVLEIESRYIHDIKSGKSKNPGANFIEGLIVKLGINPEWLFQDSDKTIKDESKFVSGANLDEPKCNTVLHLTWKDRMARIHEIVGLHEPQDLPFCFGYKDHGLIWGLINGKTPAPTEDELREIIRVFGLNEEWIRTGQEPVFRKGFNYLRLAEKYKEEHPQAIGGPAAPLGGTQGPDDLQALPFQGTEALQDPGAFLIPLIDQPVSAGGGTELNGHDDVHSFIPVPKALRRYGKRLAAVPVRGDSMEPTIYHDDMVVCDTCGWEGDGIYVLRMDDGAYVKRLAKRPKGVRVISDNKAYDAYDVNPEADGVAVVGRVRCILRVVR